MIVENLATGTASNLRLARNKIVVNIPAYDIEGIEDRSSIDYMLDIYLPEYPGANNYTLLETLEAKESPVVQNGSIETYNGAFFEIDDILLSFLAPTAPDFLQDKIKILPYSTTSYYCVVRIVVNSIEVYSEEMVPETAIFSGVAARDYADYSSNFFSDYIGKERRFLTYKPQIGYLAKDQPEILCWLNNYSDDISTLKLKVVARTKGGSEIEGIALSLDRIERNGVYSIPVSLNVLKTIHSEKVDVEQYSIWLLSETDSRVSEVRTFIVDDKYRRNSRYIYFLNSLGVFECLRLTGEASEQFETSSEIADRFAGYSYLAKYAERIISDKSARRILNINLQYSKKDIIEFLGDFALSSEYYLFSDRELLPLIPRFTNYTISDDGEDFGARSFAFEFANAETLYSKLPLATSIPIRPKEWVPFATACEIDSRGRRTGMLKVTMLELVYSDTFASVIPRVLKPNIQNEEGYLEPVENESCALATTPFLSVEISKNGSFTKSDCSGSNVGTAALITIAAEAWGSEVSQADADAKAESEFDILDTQAFADANGSCELPSTNGLRSKFWNFVSATHGFGPAFDFSSNPLHTDIETNANSNDFSDTYPDAVTAGVTENKMVMELNGYLKAMASVADLQLIANVDDGIRIFLNGELILNSWKYDAGNSKDKVSSKVEVVANQIYPIKIQLYNEDGYFGNQLSWKWTGQVKTLIPDAQFFYI
ncbi:DUF5977 domain-containing protein [Marinilongibacter aquaticus]|uniref:DUF5977 domain-containing protein n=1 Tax=Marinilongibacter aquaticus TaxID=2975157 RepID=UPI0021BD0413|nr:PA14 domain-containing protein [Marinilongibacter aquaticus]UBM58221.1 DUF5977 domain-containing protein [Marinilongibacter aquaticus]